MLAMMFNGRLVTLTFTTVAELMNVLSTINRKTPFDG
jgi:hypothetical protein